MYSKDMIKWAQDLFPINRSLTGDGVRQTLDYLKAINAEIRTHSFKTDEQVFDWTIPKEWSIMKAYFKHIDSGVVYCDFSKNNLFVVGYSTPVKTTLSREKLVEHIFTDPSQPDFIPYVTSYYKERWGFCMPHNEMLQLPDGEYEVLIESSHFDGELLVADAILEGQSSQEVMLSSYICHPSMANNELSGPVVWSALLKYIREQYPKPRFSYRFVLVPETIGSIAYMNRFITDLKANIVAGFNLSCVGDDRAYSHVQTPYGDTLADEALRAALFGRDDVKTYSFLQRGSDERQYCSPGAGLPVAGFCRSKYGEYPEYHTSADNFDLVTETGLQGALEVLIEIVDAFETGLYPKTGLVGEPQLGKRGLYPTISQKNQYEGVKARMNFLAYCDGTNSLFDLVRLIGVPLKVVIEEAKLLSEHGLIKNFDQRQNR